MMEGTISQIIGSSLLQLHKIANYINNINPGEYLLYGVLTNQDNKYSLEAI